MYLILSNILGQFETPSSLLEHKAELEEKIAEMRYKTQEEYNQTEINQQIYDRTNLGLLITRDKFNEVDFVKKKFDEKLEKWQRINYISSNSSHIILSRI